MAIDGLLLFQDKWNKETIIKLINLKQNPESINFFLNEKVVVSKVSFANYHGCCISVALIKYDLKVFI